MFDEKLFQSNLNRMRQHQPKLAQRLQKERDKYSILEPSVQETSSGCWCSFGDLPRFFQPVPKEGDFPRDKRTSLFLVFGVGSPPYLFQVSRALPKGTLGVVVFEPHPELLIYTLGNTSVYSAMPLGARLSFVVFGEDELVRESLEVNVRPMGTYALTDAMPWVHKGEEEAWGKVFGELKESFYQAVRFHLDTLGNSPEDTLLGFRQIVLNTPWLLLSPSLEGIGKSLEGIPAVCIASGPSLEKNLAQLKGMEDRCLIFCADTALRRVLREGIRPHVVSTLERPVAVYNNYFRPLLEEFGDECKEILLVSQGVSAPQIQGRWPGPKVAVGKLEIPVDQWYIGKLLGRNMLRSGMSVAHMNLVLASFWKAGRVALIGQDLAYGEAGETHAEATSAPSAQQVERERGVTGGFEVPGALGGMVRTQGIWHSFLKVFEMLIPDLGVPVYDCTEGGALIRGSEVMPLKAFLEAWVEPSTVHEGAIWNKAFEEEDGTVLDFRLMQMNLEDAGRGLIQRSRDSLEKIRVQVEAAARASSPEGRRLIATKLSGDLDSLNSMNPVLAFIGQSYANFYGAAIARSRWLETPEEVREWKRVYLDILEAHGSNLKTLEQWLEYGHALLGRFAELGPLSIGEIRTVVFAPLDNEEAFRRFTAMLSDWGTRDDKLMGMAEWQELNLLVGRCDAGLSPWTPEARWTLAMLLHAQGRAEEAFHLMEIVFADYIGSERPIIEIVQFLKDLARVASTHDLCFVPKFSIAKSLLENALDYAPDDPEIPSLVEDLISRWEAYFDDLRSSGFVREDMAFDYKRLSAERALIRKELPSAVRLVWELVRDYHVQRPGEVRGLAQWLLRTVEVCRLAEDPAIAEVADEVVTGLVDSLPLLGKLRLRLTPGLVAWLREKGVDIQAQALEMEEEVLEP